MAAIEGVYKRDAHRREVIMAGRPLRRLRAALNNPLVGWEYVGQWPRAEEIDRVSRPMYSKNAPRVFEQKLKTSLLDIYVIVGEEPEGTPAREELLGHIDGLVREGKTVLWMRQPLRSFLREFERSDEELDRRFAVPRGEGARRLSPMTPFTLLHRMGDALRSSQRGDKRKRTEAVFIDIGHAFGMLEDFLDRRMTEAERYPLYSTGVNTLAGRSGWFRDWKEATSDLWAKYVLTGKIDYDPDAGGPWTPEQLNARRDYAKSLRSHFPKLLELSRGNVFLVAE